MVTQVIVGVVHEEVERCLSHPKLEVSLRVDGLAPEPASKAAGLVVANCSKIAGVQQGAGADVGQPPPAGFGRSVGLVGRAGHPLRAAFARAL